MKKVLILNGPNLNLLGKREPGIYSDSSLEDINKSLQASSNLQLEFFQSNAEHELINRIHQAEEENISFIIFNPAAFTHTSIALRDSLLAVAIPFIEVHLSNIHAREEFRHTSYFSDIAEGVISGLGIQSYQLALRAIEQKLANKE